MERSPTSPECAFVRLTPGTEVEQLNDSSSGVIFTKHIDTKLEVQVSAIVDADSGSQASSGDDRGRFRRIS